MKGEGKMAENLEDLQKRLSVCLSRAYQTLAPFRMVYKQLVEEYAGADYAHTPTSERMAINLLQQMIEAYTVILAGTRPRVMVSTRHMEYRAFAAKFEAVLNRYLEAIDFDEVLRRIVVDAILQAGIAKCHISDVTPASLALTNVDFDPGVPIVSAVHLDDFVIDVAARDLSQVRFIGDKYRVPRDRLLDLFDFSAEQKERINSALWRMHGSDRLETILNPALSVADTLEPMVELADIWLPARNEVWTVVVDGEFNIIGEPLIRERWYGDSSGPYSVLGFLVVPGNVMPSSVAAQVVPLARMANTLILRQWHRAQLQKQVFLYQASGSAGAENVIRAGEGDWVAVDDPAGVQSVTIGGADSASVQFASMAIDLFDRMAGNLRLLLGLGAQTQTVGQEQMLMQATSRRLNSMYSRLSGFCSRLVKSLAYMLWHDEALEMTLRMPVDPILGLFTTDVWVPGDRRGRFYDYDIEVDVYSMAYRGPSERLQSIVNIALPGLVQLAPLMASQGGAIDIRKVVGIYADLLNEPRLRDLVSFGFGPPAQSAGMVPPSGVGASGGPAGASAAEAEGEGEAEGGGAGQAGNAEAVQRLQEMIAGLGGGAGQAEGEVPEGGGVG